MGSIYYYQYCAGCKKRFRKQVDKCDECGGEIFRRSDWYISYYSNGRQIHEKVGKITLARKALAKREAEAQNQKFGIEKHKKVKMKDFLLGDYWKLYASKKRSARTFESRIRVHIIPEFGDRFLYQIESVDLARWIARLEEKYPVATVNKLLALMKSIYSKAVFWKMTECNPAAGIKVRKEHNERKIFLSKEQFHALIEASEHEYLKAAISLAVGTCLRRENLFSLKWGENVDMANRQIRISSEMTKNGEPVNIPMWDMVYNVLNSLTRATDNPYVLFNLKTRTRFNNMRRSFDSAKKKAGIDPALRWHDLRHTGASWLTMAGVPSRSIMALMNVKSETVLRRYAHLSPEHLQAQVRKLDEFISEDERNIRLAQG